MLVKRKFDVDFYIVDKYPLTARPFYTVRNKTLSISSSERVSGLSPGCRARTSCLSCSVVL